MITTTVYCHAIIDRLTRISNRLTEISENFQLLPVLKNNSNGIGIKNMLDIIDIFNLTHLGNINNVATSYTEEGLEFLKLDNDKQEINKGLMSWIWTTESIEELNLTDNDKIKGNFIFENDKIQLKSSDINYDNHKNDKKLMLVVKNKKQLVYCLEHNIIPVIWFNLGMNRGGFDENDISTIVECLCSYSDLLLSDGKIKIGIGSHCPYSDGDKIDKKYIKLFDSIVKNFEEYLSENEIDFIDIDHLTYSNSAVFRFLDKNPLLFKEEYNNLLKYKTYFRLGEVLLLPDTNFQNYDYNPFVVSTKALEVFELTDKKKLDVGYEGNLDNKYFRQKSNLGDIYAVLPFGYYHFNKLNKIVLSITDKKTNQNITPPQYFNNVVAQMHDMTMVNLGSHEESKKLVEMFNNPNKYSLEFQILSLDLMESNSQDSVKQKTFCYNKHMVKYRVV